MTAWQTYYLGYLREWSRTGKRPKKYASQFAALLAAHYPEARVSALVALPSPAFGIKP